MAPRSPLDYDISAFADKRRRQRARGLTGAFDTGERVCEVPGCGAPGRYRAPFSPDRLDEYRWFCLDHVRDYNRAWDFFGDRSGAEIDRQVEADRLWGRPTWAFAGGAGPRIALNPHLDGRAWRRLGRFDPLDLLGSNGTINGGGAEEARQRALGRDERRALEILGASALMAKSEIRRLYKELVKALHPDTNGGSRADESRLQKVFWAWGVIRASRRFPD